MSSLLPASPPRRPRRDVPTPSGGVKVPDQLALIFLLLPGFMTQRTSEYYSTGAKLSDIETLASALAFTLVDVAVAVLVWRSMERRRDRHNLTFGSLVQQPLFLVILLVVAVVAGFVWAAADAGNWLYAISPTDRSSRQPIWDQRFAQNARLEVEGNTGGRGGAPKLRKGLILVVGSDGAFYLGVPKQSSDAVDKEEAVLLEPAAIVRQQTAARNGGDGAGSGTLGPCRLSPSVFLPRSAIRVVEFLNAVPQRKGPSYCDRLNELVRTAVPMIPDPHF